MYITSTHKLYIVLKNNICIVCLSVLDLNYTINNENYFAITINIVSKRESKGKTSKTIWRTCMGS